MSSAPPARARLLWVAVFVSLFGSGLNGAAVSWYVLERTGSTVAVGLLWVLITAPGLVVPAIGGVFIDRADRRRLHLRLDLVRAVVVLAAAVLVGQPALALPTVYVLCLLLGLGWPISWPTLSALVQELAPSGGMVRASAAYQVSIQAGMMSAGALVGFAYNTLGLPGILVVDAFTYVTSAACLALLASVPRAQAHQPGGRFLDDVREGLGYLRAHPPVLALGAAWACMMGGVLSGTVLLVSLARDVLKAGAPGYGYLEAGWAAGAVLGGVLAGRLVRGRAAALLPALTLGALAAGHGALPYISALGPAVAAEVAFGGCRALGGVAMQSTLLKVVPRRLMGRVQSTFAVFSTVLQVLMSVLLGWMAQAVSLPAAFLAVGALYAVAAGAALRARRLAADALERSPAEGVGDEEQRQAGGQPQEL
jgi:MFS transporter, DHA3 family, macrolide efflux protein